MEIPIYVSILVLLLFLSAIFSATETAFSSANIIRIKQQAIHDRKSARAYYLLKDFTSVITAILICNNVVNILATSLATYVLSLYFNEMGVLIATVAMTIMIVLFGEITPKLLAKQHAERFVLFMTPIILGIIFILKPFIKIAVNVQDTFVDEDDNVTATEEELIQIVHTIEKEGVLDQDERELIESAIQFDDKKVREAMIPLANVTFVYDNSTQKQVLEVINRHKYSRIPVVSYKTLQAVGVIRERDVLEVLIRNKKVVLKDLIRPAITVSQRTYLPDLLEQLQKSREHMAIVVETKKNDNFIGIITLEDIIEELVGEIYDEYDDLPNQVIEIGHHTYEVDGNTPIKQFFSEYLDELAPTASRNFEAWVLEIAEEKKLRVGTELDYKNFYFKIIEMDKGKITKIEFQELSKLEEEI
ncbi:MAG: hemolysin family protein [Erysipelotrichaceae bacterium]